MFNVIEPLMDKTFESLTDSEVLLSTMNIISHGVCELIQSFKHNNNECMGDVVKLRDKLLTCTYSPYDSVRDRSDSIYKQIKGGFFNEI